jgi:diguanylate cyclase (GGDEF)-like protein
LEEDLNTDLSILESHLGGMLDRVCDNSKTLRNFQKYEKKLLSLNSLSEMVEYILHSTKEYFDLDMVSFCIIDEQDEISAYLADDGFKISEESALIFLQNKELLRTTFGFAKQPYVGSYKIAKCASFFPVMKKKLASVAIIPLSRRGKYLGSMNLGSLNPSRFVESMATDFVEHMAYVVSICLENNLNFEILKKTSLIDTLTGVNNRRFLEQRLGEEVDRSQRSSEPLTCFFLDIDFFKSVNDNYGHQVGDQVLAVVAKTIREQLRNNDVLARYGGEEFVALLSNIDDPIATDIAERIRGKIKALAINAGTNTLQITISIGIATFVPGKEITHDTKKIAESLIHSADDALYQAKHSGRDRVISAGELSEHILIGRKVI